MKSLELISILATVAALSGCICDVMSISCDSSISDYTPVVKNIMENGKKRALKLEFEKGTYHFYPQEATQKYLAVSNNDNGDKKIVFCLEGLENVVIEGNGSEFIFHGSEIPFAILSCRDVTVRNLSVDYDHPFVLEGEVVENCPEKSSFTIRINGDNLYEVRDSMLYLKGYDWELPLGENIVFDKATGSPYRNCEKFEGWIGNTVKAEDLGDRLVRISGFTSAQMPPVGSIYIDKGPHGRNRTCPGFAVQESSAIRLEGVRIHGSGAMALIAENSSDITCKNFDVCLKEYSGRMISASADATHFVGCSGKIVLKDCLFESMLDDATNVHGTYMVADSLTGSNTVIASFGHFQQEGFRFAEAGDSIAFIDRSNLKPVLVALLKEIECPEQNRYVMTFDRDLLPVGNVRVALENRKKGADLEVSNCTVRKNRARSLLISTGGHVVVEDCDFASMMAGIRICGDANYWFESGPVRDVVIRRNIFRGLGNGGWSPQAVLQVDPVIPATSRSSDIFFHGNVTFEDNTIHSSESQLIYCLSAANLRITGNRFIRGRETPRFPGLSVIDVQYCGTVDISGNDFSFWEGGATVSVHNCVTDRLHIDTELETVDNPNRFYYEN
ncbi:MAG: right-handed parallel beta-helix repeat-containing protein [Candidatus Cryptobacteroides sp.]